MGICKNYLSKAKLSKKRLFTDNAKNESSDRKATVFAWFMEDGKGNDLNLLENSSKGRILSLTEETFEVLLEKHLNIQWHTCRRSSKCTSCKIRQYYSEMVRDAIKKTRGSAGPSSLDADGLCQILMSTNFGTPGEDLRKAIADNDQKTMST